MCERENEPTYEAADCGCECTEDGMASEWNWDPEQECYVCEGCGEVQ
jgi:hypothetical protein